MISWLNTHLSILLIAEIWRWVKESNLLKLEMAKSNFRTWESNLTFSQMVFLYMLTLLETAEEQETRIRNTSKYGHLMTWKLARIIIKSGDDLR